MPKFSIVIPTRARPDTLAHALRTAVEQTYEDVEIVVMDVVGNGLYHTRGAATATYRFGGNFIKGMYFIQILYKDGTKVLKAIRQ